LIRSKRKKLMIQM